MSTDVQFSWGLQLVAPFFLSFIFTYFVKNICEKIKLYSEVNKRSCHIIPIPRLGGVAVFAVFLLFTLNQLPFFLIVCASLMFVVGLVDDLVDLSPKIKLIGQMICSATLISNGVYLPISFLPEYMSIMFSFIWIISILNAINFIDGLDGLVSGYSIISLVSILILTAFLPITIPTIPICILIFCILGFLTLNANPATIFLGDSGSLSLATLLIYFIITSFSGVGQNLPWALPLIILSFPFIDLINVVVRRTLSKESILKADKRHIHHIVYKKLNKLDHVYAVTLLYFIMMILCVGIPLSIIIF